MVTIKVLFFASAREAANNTTQIDLDLTDENSNTGSLRYAEIYEAFQV